MRVRHLCLRAGGQKNTLFPMGTMIMRILKSLHPPQGTNVPLENSCRKAGTMGV
jgi:hypothetical protein